MKKTLTIIAVAVLMTACGTARQGARLPERTGYGISWNAFCVARGHSTSDNSPAVLDEYLDTWRGTAEEEKALLKAGHNPF